MFIYLFIYFFVISLFALTSLCLSWMYILSAYIFFLLFIQIQRHIFTLHILVVMCFISFFCSRVQYNVWFSFRLFKLGRCKVVAKLSTSRKQRWRKKTPRQNEQSKWKEKTMYFISISLMIIACSWRFNNSE